MRRCGAFLLFIVCLVSCSAVAIASDWMARPGTIKHALTLADGSTVSLDAEIIDKIVASGSPAYFVIRECFDSKSRIVVMTQPSSELRLGQTVDVQGVISTLSDGQRVIVSPTVYGYTDRDGNLLYHGPLIKGPTGPTAWEWKVNLTVSARQMMTMDEEPTPPGEPNTSPPVGATQYSTIADAKLLADGTPVELLCKPITSTGTNCFFIDEDASGNPLKVYCAKSVTTSQRVCRVTGTMQTEGSDRVLTVDASGPGYDPQVFVGSLTVANAGTIAWVKTWADNHAFPTGDLTGKIVTRKWDNCFYIEEDDRSNGIRVDNTAHGRSAGERVDVVGVLKTDAANYERYIDASGVSQNGTGSVAPLGMINRSLGGGDFYYDPNTGQGQRGITGAAGLNSIGLLVRTWGKITGVDTASPAQWFRITDGSNVQTTVAYPPFTYAVNDFITVVGISTCEVDAFGDLQRVLRPQPLTCTISKAAGQPDPTNSTPINFTVVFSEPVTDFNDADDVQISGTAGGSPTVTITQTDMEGKEHNVAVSGLTYGTVIAAVPSGKAQNTSGAWNYTSASTDNTVAYCGNVVYVKTTANGGNDSNSGWRWDDAKATVGAALTTAVTYGQTQVWVGKGTYNERITLPAGKALYGGFIGDGSEDEISDRPAFPRPSPDDNETVLDGQYGGNVVTAASTNVYNTLNGFTIQHGSSYGVTSSTVLTIYNCKITSNGTGIRMTANTVISGNEITYNTADGIHLSSSSGGTVSANKINHNARRGIYCTNGGSFGYVIDRNFIEYNNTFSPSYAGGGVSCDVCSDTPKIVNNFIRGNGATKGGGIYCYQSTPNIYNNTIVDNSCSASGSGAGMYVRNLQGQNLYAANNIIAYNTGGYGMYIDNSGLNYSYTVNLSKNCTYQNSSGSRGVSGYNASFAGTGNEILDAPQLSADRYHLASGSRCIDAGDITRNYGSYDIDGNARIINSLLDVGCDEAQ